MSGIQRYEWVEDGMGRHPEGEYVTFDNHAAEIARLRAELDNAAAAALANMSLACEKEREADALRVDAERYRFLRSGGCGATLRFHNSNPATRDEMIDAAMGADA